MKRIVSRIAICGAVVAVLTTLIAMPATAAPAPLAAPKVSVANPAPGDYLRRGGNWVGGVACDPDAPLNDPTGGIAKVSIFLGDRDTAIGVPSFRPGGYYGAATIAGTNAEFSSNAAIASRLGIASPDVSMCRQTQAAWRVLPSSFRKGVWDMNIYVLAKNGKETKVTIAGLRVDKP
ncbi:MAG TPA: hypothetical protein VGL99_21140 [Chloroflexota bacterium]|jgi:hypothetical protein